MKTTTILITAMLFMSCSGETVDVEPRKPQLGEGETLTVRQKLDQDVTLGTLMATITMTIYDYEGDTLCWSGTTDPETEVLSAAAAIDVYEDHGFDTGNGPEAAVYELMDSGARAVHVIVTPSSGPAYDYLVVPDADAPGNDGGHFLKLGGEPTGTETCVTCTEHVGKTETEGENCQCKAVVKKKCGTDPFVSCLSQCASCPTGENAPTLQMAALCGYGASSTVLFSAIDTGESL